ncbi:MAG: iron ABC transporter permease [Acidobacteriota bacterium]|nr:iron ABC transporter permease [Acidobacteriota bacterium]
MSGAALGAAVAAVLPLVYLVIRSFERGWAGFADTVVTGQVLALLTRTLGLVVGVVAVATTLALPMAWLVARTDLPRRRLWTVVGALPLVFPSYVAAFSLVAVLGPTGRLQQLLARWGVERLPDLAYGYSGALLLLSLFTYPYLYLLLVAAFRDLDPALEESSRSLGIGRRRTFFRVVVPQLRPALYSGILLIALYTLSDFGGVSIVRFNTFTLSIFQAYQALLDRTVAASLAMLLALLSFVLIFAEARLIRGIRPHRTGVARPSPPVRLGKWKWPATTLLAAVALLNLGLPLLTVTVWGVHAFLADNPLTGPSGQSVGVAAVRSLGVAAAAAVVAVALALPIVTWAVRYPSRLGRWVERLAHSGFALPGLVLALSLVFMSTRMARPLYQSLTLLVVAYVVRFLPEALAATRAAMVTVSPHFEEVARSLGRRPMAILSSLTIPLVRPGLLAGAGLVFLTTMKELPATLILRPTGFETLATRIWSNASEGIYSQAAVPSLWLLVMSALPMYWLVIRPALAPRKSTRAMGDLLEAIGVGEAE